MPSATTRILAVFTDDSLQQIKHTVNLVEKVTNMQRIIYYHNKEMIRSLRDDQILVVGTNSRGIHGAGAAKTAHRYFGAKYGQAFGLQGRAYGIPTRFYLDRKENNSLFKDIPLKQIKTSVELFFKDAAKMPHLTFVITRIGCGFAGYEDKDIAPLFSNPLNNMVLPQEWLPFIDHDEAILFAF